MRDSKWSRRMVVAAGTLALVALGASREADAHPRGRGRVVVYGGGYYGFNPWFGMGFGPYWGWGPYYPGIYPPGGVDMNAAMIAGFGAVELKVKPNRADVWVDGRYVGEARDLDGYPTYLWLADGPHRLAVHKGGFLVFDEQIDVRRGMRTEIKLKLAPGDSPPPGTRPAEKTQEKEKDKPKDKEKSDE
jgi:PEGA domain